MQKHEYVRRKERGKLFPLMECVISLLILVQLEFVNWHIQTFNIIVYLSTKQKERGTFWSSLSCVVLPSWVNPTHRIRLQNTTCLSQNYKPTCIRWCQYSNDICSQIIWIFSIHGKKNGNSMMTSQTGNLQRFEFFFH